MAGRINSGHTVAFFQCNAKDLEFIQQTVKSAVSQLSVVSGQL